MSLLLEYFVRKRQVRVDTLVDAHPQPSEHDGDKPGRSAHIPIACVCSDNSPASTRTAYYVKVVARLWRRVWVDRLHKLLKDHQRRQAANPAAVEREQAEPLIGHS